VQQVIPSAAARKLAFYHDAPRLLKKDFDVIEFQVFLGEVLLFDSVLLFAETSKSLTTVF